MAFAVNIPPLTAQSLYFQHDGNNTFDYGLPMTGLIHIFLGLIKTEVLFFL